MKATRIAVFAASCLFSTLASAQTKINFVSPGAKAGDKPPTACVDEAKILLDRLAKYPHPESWRWIVACTDSAWAGMLRNWGIDTAGTRMYALTDRAMKITYINGEALAHPDVSPQTAPDHIIAHELGHIYLDSSDEHKVDSLAQTWVSAKSKNNI